VTTISNDLKGASNRIANFAPALHSADDVAAVLRSRLRISGALIFPVGLVLAVVGISTGIVTSFAQAFQDPPYIGWLLAVGWSSSIVGLIITQPSRKLSLLQLRWVETLGVGSGVVACAAVWTLGLSRIPASAIAVLEGMDAHLGAALLAAAGSVVWVVMMLGYAIYIPNTWKRCAAAMLILSLLATVPDYMVIRQWSVPPAFLGTYFGMRIFWLIDAALFAMYGTRRIEALRSEVAAARKLGQYELKSLLGGGGMGEVYMAEHTFLRRPCAVKLIRPSEHLDLAAIQRFEREVQTTATLTHPNAVQIYDYGRAEDGTFFYAMEYLPGQSLEELVERDGPLECRRAIHFVRQICGPLREAHQLGLIHRDIKPSNVLVCERGGVSDVAKLLDFGLVVPISALASHSAETRLTQAGMIVGTPAFMSPEQVGGDDLGAASDIYSMGALLYFLVTGQPPFGNRNAGQVLAAHIYEAPKPPSALRPEINAAVDAVVLKCLAKSATDRFSSAGELEQALARVG
jgi:hypothetical protein